MDMVQRSGGYMKVGNSFGNDLGYLEDTTKEYPYTRAVSKIDEEVLNKIANDMGIDYINMSKQSNIDSRINEIKRKYEKNVGDEFGAGYTETYYLFAIPLLGLFVYEFIIYKRRLV